MILGWIIITPSFNPKIAFVKNNDSNRLIKDSLTDDLDIEQL
jgi:hypothetical protein